MSTLDQAIAPAPSMSPKRIDTVVRAEALSKRFRDVVAVDDVSFELGRGTVTGFLGPNGAGKTTTLRMLLDLVEPTSGSAAVFGRRYRELARPASRSCATRPP
jgi:ABC-2 type transport system ATP-binding protein